VALLLSLDCSTTACGVCCFYGNKLSERVYKVIDISKAEDKFEKIKIIIKGVVEYKPSNICIEDYIKFMPNKSQASTTLALAHFSGMLQYSLYKEFNIVPVMINHSSACSKVIAGFRKLVKISSQLYVKYPVPKNVKLSKLVVFDEFIKYNSTYEIITKRGGSLHGHNFDIADSWINGKYYAGKLSGEYE
jgi:hypothetical protein